MHIALFSTSLDWYYTYKALLKMIIEITDIKSGSKPQTDFIVHYLCMY